MRRAKTPGSVRSKGQKGEREVVALFREHGYPDAVRSPGSGAIRSSGAGSLSPWPGDLAFVKPWLVEVKRAEVSHRTGAKVQRTWPGSSFIKATLRDLTKLADFHQRMVVPRPWMVPVLFIRGGGEPWRVWITSWRLEQTFAPALDDSPTDWCEVDTFMFFDHILPPVREEYLAR